MAYVDPKFYKTVVTSDRRVYRVIETPGTEPVVLDLGRAGFFQRVEPHSALWDRVLKASHTPHQFIADTRPGG